MVVIRSCGRLLKYVYSDVIIRLVQARTKPDAQDDYSSGVLNSFPHKAEVFSFMVPRYSNMADDEVNDSFRDFFSYPKFSLLVRVRYRCNQIMRDLFPNFTKIYPSRKRISSNWNCFKPYAIHDATVKRRRKLKRSARISKCSE